MFLHNSPPVVLRSVKLKEYFDSWTNNQDSLLNLTWVGWVLSSLCCQSRPWPATSSKTTSWTSRWWKPTSASCLSSSPPSPAATDGWWRRPSTSAQLWTRLRRLLPLEKWWSKTSVWPWPTPARYTAPRRWSTSSCPASRKWRRSNLGSSSYQCFQIYQFSFTKIF